MPRGLNLRDEGEAAPTGPRVILLDEVFVGVDTTNRGQIFALLSALDLDLLLTSDHEWCTYAELSGNGIHQILTGDEDDAVTTARFTWMGVNCRRCEGNCPHIPARWRIRHGDIEETY